MQVTEEERFARRHWKGRGREATSQPVLSPWELWGVIATQSHLPRGGRDVGFQASHPSSFAGTTQEDETARMFQKSSRGGERGQEPRGVLAWAHGGARGVGWVAAPTRQSQVQAQPPSVTVLGDRAFRGSFELSDVIATLSYSDRTGVLARTGRDTRALSPSSPAPDCTQRKGPVRTGRGGHGAGRARSPARPPELGETRSLPFKAPVCDTPVEPPSRPGCPPPRTLTPAPPSALPQR